MTDKPGCGTAQLESHVCVCVCVCVCVVRERAAACMGTRVTVTNFSFLAMASDEWMCSKQCKASLLTASRKQLFYFGFSVR